MKHPSFPSVRDVGCERVRVAEGDLAAVDRCGCGTYQVHLSAFTLRLAPEALASLLETLSEALAAGSAVPLGHARNPGNVTDRWSKS